MFSFEIAILSGYIRTNFFNDPWLDFRAFDCSRFCVRHVFTKYGNGGLKSLTSGAKSLTTSATGQEERMAKEWLC